MIACMWPVECLRGVYWDHSYLTFICMICHLFHCSVQCYVDDTKLLLSFLLQDQSCIVAEINQDLTRIRNWCFDNQLLLNPDKTKLLVCGSKLGVSKTRDFKLSFLGKQLSPVETARDLGVILDTSFNFDRDWAR